MKSKIWAYVLAEDGFPLPEWSVKSQFDFMARSYELGERTVKLIKGFAHQI